MSPRLLIVPALLALTGCGMGPDSAAPIVRDETPVLGHLRSRDRILTFSGGAGGPRFTVRALDGSVLADRLTSDELARHHPTLRRVLDTAFAAQPEPRRGLVTTDGKTPLLIAE